jgi:glucan phosphoethanolaminetransferase (alkaline phosphatase superfamily)
MDEMLGMSVGLHVGFALVVLLVAIGHVAMLLAKQEFKWLSPKIHWWIPAYYFLLSCLLFTGLITWTAIGFQLTHWVAMMLLAWMMMLGGSIMAYKRFKRTKTSRAPELQNAFKSFALKKYLFDCFVVIGLYLGAA